MGNFERDYGQLNDEQRAAVDTIDGPLLVLAGPGTGKTQLLSARVANILRQTDTLPSSILCLTFTDAAALNMRERLSGMIGEDAYDVHIGTYHSFASDIIKTYPDYFSTIDLDTGEDSRMERPINELGQLEIVKAIVDGLPFSDPLRSSRYYIKSVVSTIADLKQANLTPAQVRRIATDNAAACTKLSGPINDVLAGMKQMPRKAAEAQALFSDVMEILEGSTSDLAVLAAKELGTALEQSAETNKTNPLTTWKNGWLQKDDNDRWTFTDPNSSAKMLSLAAIYERYQQTLETAGEYDFNDMILKTIGALTNKPELRFNLQEKYQYILLDEFQDTNAAQFELVRLPADHPVHEGRPNIMAVGDDDQGIFAFQGADIGNMNQFIASFRDVRVINLCKNYRSHADILLTAHAVAEQIESRLHHNLEGISKDIEAAADNLPELATIARHEFNSAAAENGWIADNIAEQIKQGIDAKQIAVLAPKHAILETLVPFLNKRGIPVTYEKRENIFETPVVQGILLVCSFLLAAADKHMALMDELLPRVLSLDYWQIPVEIIWQLNWEHARLVRDDDIRWCERALGNDATREPVRFLLGLADTTGTIGLELTLDYVTGAKTFHEAHGSYTSPFKDFYFSENSLQASSLEFYEAISHLSVIREQLREQQARDDHRLDIANLLALYRTYEEAEQPLLNTHPIAQAESSVQLLTVYKAKGLEYEYVYLPTMHDNVWGSTARGGGNKLTVPPNLAYIRHDSSGDDNQRRLLFVALTRAKTGLIMTSHAQSESGKKTLPVKYMQEKEDENGTRRSGVLPLDYQAVIVTDREPEQLRLDVDTLWHSRHTELTADLRSLLTERLQRYVMSPTHLNTFTNIEYAGPYQFLLGTLLRFPEAPTPDSIYGDALHRALEQYQKAWQTDGGSMTLIQAQSVFAVRIDRSYMSDTDKLAYAERGKQALQAYLRTCGERLKQPAGIEVDFRREGCVLGDAILTGKMDRLEIDKSARTVRIIDFKSGNPSIKWGSSSKYLNYKQQLYFYHLLIETSRSYKDYRVESAALEFIEPLPTGECAPPLELVFDQAEYDQVKRLVMAVWRRIRTIDLPDITSYATTAAGIRQFEADLLSS